jgi:uncharacterized OB-fold protein
MTDVAAHPDVDARPYLEGLATGEIRLQYCTDCDRFQFPPRAFCVRCGGGNLDWRPSSGAGVIYAMTVCHRPALEALADSVPYAVALIDLEEGVRLMARAAVPPDAVKTGMPVHVFPEEAPIDPGALLFRPREGATE